MDPISSYAHQQWAMSQTQERTEGPRERERSEGDAIERMGDRIDISEAALELLASKMEESDAETPQDLTPEERDEIRNALAEAMGVSEGDREALAAYNAQGMQAGRGGMRGAQGGQAGPPPGGGQGGPGGPQGMQGGKGAQGATATDETSTTEDAIEELQEEIEELQEEIAQLQAKAMADEEAAEELKMKQIELTIKQATLAQLQQEEAENA